MGLAGPKRRSKLSHDPNNTGWSTSPNAYGQKILSAQGWKPGDYLGATNASHAEHYTAANKSHIKVLLREDNLGLGASVGKSNADTFGLSLYSGVLSRLNGKDDAQVEKQQKALRDAELRTYQATKYGFMNFISGGVLVGDTIESADKQDRDGVNQLPTTSTDHGARCAKKQKLDATAADREAVHGVAKRREKRSSKVHRQHKHDAVSAPLDLHSKGLHSTEQLQDPRGKDAQATSNVDSIDADHAPTTEKSTRKGKQRVDEGEMEAAGHSPQVDQSSTKQERRIRKEERRKRKEERRRQTAVKDAAKVKQSNPLSSHPHAHGNDTSTNGSRVSVRHRYIQQKRLASLDPQAMREIFMFKAAA